MTTTEILLDCDGVLGQFAPEAVDFCNLYGREPGAKPWTIDDVTNWDILKNFGLEHLQDRLDQHMIDTDFCRHMPLYPGAQEFVEALRGLGNVTIVTSPYTAVPNWCSARYAWLAEHFNIDKRDVIFAKKKWKVWGDYLIDDQTENCIQFEAKAPYGSPLCLARPWNEDFIGRCSSFEEIIYEIS